MPLIVMMLLILAAADATKFRPAREYRPEMIQKYGGQDLARWVYERGFPYKLANGKFAIALDHHYYSYWKETGKEADAARKACTSESEELKRLFQQNTLLKLKLSDSCVFDRSGFKLSFVLEGLQEETFRKIGSLNFEPDHQTMSKSFYSYWEATGPNADDARRGCERGLNEARDVAAKRNLNLEIKKGCFFDRSGFKFLYTLQENVVGGRAVDEVRPPR